MEGAGGVGGTGCVSGGRAAVHPLTNGGASSVEQLPQVCATIGREMGKILDVVDRDLDAAATVVSPPPDAAAAVAAVEHLKGGGNAGNDVQEGEKEEEGVFGGVLEYFPLLRGVVQDMSVELVGYVLYVLRHAFFPCS